MNYKVDYACASHIGHVRKSNEDCFILGKKYMDADSKGSDGVISGQFSPNRAATLVGVFDSISGKEYGKTAAWLAARQFSSYDLDENGHDLARLCRRVNHRLSQYAYDNSILSIGTTANLLLLNSSSIVSANLGDSRTYCITKSEMLRLSKDQVAPSPDGGKGLLVQYLGASEEELHVEPHIVRCKPRNGDIYLLCTDGLTDMVSEAEIAEIVRELLQNENNRNNRKKDNSLETAAKALLNRALQAGGRDNITLILCQIVAPRRGLFALFGGRG